MDSCGETGMQSHTLAVTWDELLSLSCLHTKQTGLLGRGSQAPPGFLDSHCFIVFLYPSLFCLKLVLKA